MCAVGIVLCPSILAGVLWAVVVFHVCERKLRVLGSGGQLCRLSCLRAERGQPDKKQCAQSSQLFRWSNIPRSPAPHITRGATKKKETKLLNRQAKDASQLRKFVVDFHHVWAAPVTAVGCTLLLLRVLGPSALVGVSLMPVLIPLETWVAKR